MKLSFAIEKELPALRAALAASRQVILSAPPGVGKSVRVPLALLEEPWLAGKRIILLEPRRLAARRAAEFMALQLGERVGETVGYRIRGERAVSAATRIEVVTEGILTRMFHADAELPAAGLVIFDEFHERSLHADLGLAFALDVQRHLRPDLRLLIMSATLDGVALSGLLPAAPVIRGEAAAWPVETFYSRPAPGTSFEQRVVSGVGRAMAAGEGDLLVFLPGMREIRRVEELLQERVPAGVQICPLHGDLPVRTQEAALAPAAPERRKVILATSIAETSLTIPGVRMALDGGLARTARFDPRRGMSTLVTLPVSRAQADQRRGRAGRTAPGLCFRLWSEAEQAQLPEFPPPEIRTADLAPLALDLALWGDPFAGHLAFIDPPPPVHLEHARELLQRLGALDAHGGLTPHGRAMAAIPVHPRLSHMILKAREAGWAASACELAALLEEGGAPGVAAGQADLAAHIEAYRRERDEGSGRSRRGHPAAGFAAARIAAQEERLRELSGLDKDEPAAGPVGVLLAWAYPDRIARRRPERQSVYLLANGATATLPEADPLSREEFLAVAEADAGVHPGKGCAAAGRIFLAAALEREALLSAFATEMTSGEEVVWDEAENRVRARRLTRLGALVIAEAAITPSAEAAATALIAGIRRAGLQLLPWDKEARQLCARAEWVRSLRPEWPAFDEAGLMQDLEVWLRPPLVGMTRLEQLQRLHLVGLLRARLTPLQRQELDALAPAQMTVPSGSRVAVDYPAAGHPVLAVKLQELFGLTETPRIGGGHVPLTLHLLSPAARPLAVTQDLRSFWEHTYPEIRKQLRARYPKHPWPEDPFSATPTRKTRSAGR